MFGSVEINSPDATCVWIVDMISVALYLVLTNVVNDISLLLSVAHRYLI